MTKKIYWENPYLHEFKAKVIDKKLKDNKWHIKLDKTIFYPDNSGGQLGDFGTINGHEVINTYEDGTDLVHVIEKDISSPTVELKIDYNRRFDLMQQHTGQHLLSGVFYNLLAADTVGFHLGEEIVTIDIAIGDLSKQEIDRVELLCNKLIQSNFKVKSYIVDKDTIGLLPIRKSPTTDENIRIIEIDDYDFSPCGGTHLNNLGELGIIKINKWEKYKGNNRIEFICGMRALNDYIMKSDIVKKSSLLLSSKDTLLYDRIEKIYDDKLKLEKNYKELKEKLYSLYSDTLYRDSINTPYGKLIINIFKDLDFKEISKMSNIIANNYEDVIQLYGIRDNDNAQFILNKSKNVDLDLQKLYNQVSSSYKTKGGGNTNTVQGSILEANLDNIITLFKDLII
ncbi:MAG: alanyl-tRNA editing protein [Gudongella sp.]|nr:alanyl-tRNA editing protein [Gudongella sp.]